MLLDERHHVANIMNQIKKLTYSGIMTAFVLISTFIVQIPLSLTGGYIHIGDAFVLLSGVILGPIYGALAAGIGSALADILGGYSSWALPTFIIKAVMAAIVGILAKKKDHPKVIFLSALTFSVLWASCMLFLRNFLETNVFSNGQTLLGEMEDISTLSQLTSLSLFVEGVLLTIAIFVPIFIIAGYFVTKKMYKDPIIPAYITSFLMSGAIMIVLYYYATYLIYGNWVLPIFDIPNNSIQFVVGIFLSYLLLPVALKITRENS